jgi:acyl transferase domain-containing protein/3-hydroxymyristoyl/3-hydroxydecanoyl-(acyl carrier protein) dehydratase
LLAKALGLGAGTFTLDAACSSSLYAIKLACDELLSGRADMMLAGGSCRPDCLYTQMGFAQLRALSQSGKCSPFDRNADGLMVGEGAGIFALKRLADAERDGDDIRAVLCGWGLSNDTAGNLLAPAKEGQLRAMRAAYAMAGWQPDDVQLIECHATGTPVGDAVEFESLSELWNGSTGGAVIGSVKSTVGHLLTGAGSAALAKVILAMAHRQLPPQANFSQPSEGLKYDGGPFMVLNRAEPWEAAEGSPRRAAVSGFGFGGINAHLLVEEYLPGWKDIRVRVELPKPLNGPLPELATVNSPREPRPSQDEEANVRPIEGIAVVGIAAHVGPWTDAESLASAALGLANAPSPSAKVNGWGNVDAECPPGHYIEELTTPLDRFRIPPREMEEMLPQQLLMLRVAAAAMEDFRSPASTPEIRSNEDFRSRSRTSDVDLRTGVFIGLGLDLNTTNFHVRWAELAAGREPQLPPLTADRTMGALGSIAASRIARAFHFGGPSFTCCSEETSSGTALALAVKALRLGEIDRAVVGGVDLAGDPRQLLASASERPTGEGQALAEAESGLVPAEGAAALVVKRLADAERDGDRIYAVIRGIGTACGGPVDAATTNAAAYASSFIRACADGMVEPAGLDSYDAAASGAEADDRPEAEALGAILGSTQRQFPLNLSASRGRLGHTGAASTVVALVQACAALHRRTLPPGVRAERLANRQNVIASKQPRHWLADDGEPRRLAVASSGADGNCVHVVLEGRSVGTVRPERHEGLFGIDGGTPAELVQKINRLQLWLEDHENRPIDAAARAWFAAAPPHANRRFGAAFVARSVAELNEQLAFAEQHLRKSPEIPFPPDLRGALRDRVFYTPNPQGAQGKIAFVFPGSGNQFPGMGRDLALAFPEILARQETENRRLRSQYAPEHFWVDTIPALTEAKTFLFGQVAWGTFASDLLVHLGANPEAMIGQSLGESAGLFGLRAWTARDEMFARIQVSTLFETDLGPPYDAARRFYGLAAHEDFDWVAGVVPAGPDDVRSHLRPGLKAYLLIVNTPNECVIGGKSEDVEALVQTLGKAFLPLHGVTMAHCEAGKPVEPEYRELHTLPVAKLPKLKVYSGAWGRAYQLTSANAAESITAGMLNTIDFPKVVEAAYREGVRAFIEVGPGNSCTRMVNAILGPRPGFARALCVHRQDGVSNLLKVLAALLAERFALDLSKLYGTPAPEEKAAPAAKASVTVPVGLPPRKPTLVPTPVPVALTPRPVGPVAPVAEVQAAHHEIDLPPELPPPVPREPAGLAHNPPGSPSTSMPAERIQNDLLRRLLGGDDDDDFEPEEAAPASQGSDVPRSLGFQQCTEYAVGKIANVLGPQFAEVDSYPTRVRLPEGPLMLVDRILQIDGEPKSLGAGRVVTEHTVRADRWYLENGRCPVSIAVESGQADLFLSGFLGIDFQTKGLAVYRLLDAVVSFHRGLPRVGERIEYDIHIDGFFRQADSWLFRFRFEGTVNGEPLLSMKNGVAGFFTAQALAAGKGIVHTRLDKQPMPGKVPDGWKEFVPFEPCSLGSNEVEALRRGDLETAFGSTFAHIRNAMPLPGGMLRLVDRVPLMDLRGGRFGLGFVRAEYDIRPKEWFIECHFVDDKVMPGTLMYECCLHTLRILMMRRGWVAEEGAAVCEPVPGVGSRLKCRGQVLDTTKLVTYEVSVKEIGFDPAPYCIADALMYADGKPIVSIENLTLRLSRVDRGSLARVWGMGDGVSANSSSTPHTPRPTPGRRPAIYGPDRIMAYSNGKPSEGFGEPYRIFDEGRIIARLPGPPYQFLDRIVEVAGEPFVLKDGAACVAEYDVPPNEWYFEANRCPLMPFSVLLEIALQPCGWLAAYCGSALLSDSDLSFRNLGGKATQFAPVGPEVGTLTAKATLTSFSKSAGMIIQHFSLLVTAGERTVYEGTTYFGFFAKAALENQVGMPQAKVPFLNQRQLVESKLDVLPHDAPFPAPMMRMVDRIDGYIPDGGSKRLGLIQGRIAVDPEFWFFKAHFYQDPVWPGSLGVESFLQLLKYVAWKRWGTVPANGWQTPAVGVPHTWTYRGQVLPKDNEVTVVLEVTAADDAARTLTADGYLVVDGRIIYHMQGFTLA